MKKKLTVKDLFELKGKRKLTEVLVASAAEAEAAEAAGIDILCCGGDLATIRAAAPNTFLIAGFLQEGAESEAAAIRAGLDRLAKGADAIYTGISTDRVKAMSREFIPVVGHVGMVPYRSSWYGGFKAVGKTAVDARAVYDLTRRYDDAGAIAVEVELVPRRVAAFISSRVRLLTMSMGGGLECDVQYLFSCDILGINTAHVPRHAKVYANLAAEYRRLQGLMVDAFAAFKAEVETGAFPEDRHSLPIPGPEFEAFVRDIKGATPP